MFPYESPAHGTLTHTHWAPLPVPPSRSPHLHSQLHPLSALIQPRTETVHTQPLGYFTSVITNPPLTTLLLLPPFPVPKEEPRGSGGDHVWKWFEIVGGS